MAEKLIVIGGTAAGLSAASKAKRVKPELEIQVFEKIRLYQLRGLWPALFLWVG